MFNKQTLATLAGSAVIAMGAQGALLQIDMSTGMAGTPTGWETISGTGSPSGTFSGYADLATGDITVSLTGIGFDRLYKNGTSGALEDFPGTDLDAMYGDTLFRNNASDDVEVTIAGLKAGTYTITSYHMTAPVTTASEFDYNVQDADSPAFGQFVGNFAMGQGNTTTTFSPTIVTFDVVSNGTDSIVLQLDATFIGTGGNTGGWYGFNGLEIVPEPSSLALLGLGGLLLARRRRG